jgi:hypothetical protein
MIQIKDLPIDWTKFKMKKVDLQVNEYFVILSLNRSIIRMGNK